MSVEWKPLRSEQKRGNSNVTWYFAYHTNYKYSSEGTILKVDRPVVRRQEYGRPRSRAGDSDLPRWWKCV